MKKFFFQSLVCFCIVLSSCDRKESMFSRVPASVSNITFENKPLEKPLFNILYYLYYYNGGGVATGDINNDGLPDIFFTANHKGGNKLYLNKGDFKFEDITENAGVKGLSDWASGVTMVDINSDGLLDIYVSTVSGRYELKGHNELYINNGDNTFTESSEKYGLNTSCATTQAAFFDYDRDGDLDCFILNQSQRPHANIVDTSYRREFDSLSGDRLLRNDINTIGRFTDVSAQAGIYQSNLGYGLGLAIADINQDGWEDIYVGNDFHENDYYYVNNGDGTFSESGASHFRHYSRFSMGNDVADYNNDGHPDVVTVDMLPPDEKILKTYGSDENPDIYRLKLERQGYQQQFSRNCLQRNNGFGKSFSETGLISGISATDWSWAPLFADFDNDGNKDLFISTGIVKRPVDLDYIRFVSDLKMKGMDKTDAYDAEAIKAMPEGSSHPYFFQGDGKGNFKDQSGSWGTEGMKGFYTGSAYADLDGDSDLDMIVNAIDAPALILKNNAPEKKSLTISFRGEQGNIFGVGTKVWLFTNGKLQYQQFQPTRGFQSSCDYNLMFGLDTVSQADSVLIVWPDQKFQLLRNVTAGKMTATKAEAKDSFNYRVFFPPATTPFERLPGQQITNWKHRENLFYDYNLQYLIPHQQSTRGPKIAVGDVNGDGLDDMYVCGAKGQPGSVMIQQKNGSFLPADTTLFNRFAICEDVDARFFDANGDGYLDLWVVSGGNETPTNAIDAADRLFINDGKGNFSYSAQSIPRLFENKSCIAVADIDRDGDNDVFIGFLSHPMQFGIPQSSYLYLNDGNAKFSIAPKEVMNLLQVGMVTSAVFTDLNNDQWPDLVVAGEWMPVKVFMNNNGKFNTIDIPQSTGLWQSLYASDVNGDGITDLLAGNWGQNSKLAAGKEPPLKLYVKDFDNNGMIEQIMCYTINGEEYTFLAKDELERSLPVLKKAYLNYSEVAGKSVQYLFYDLFKDYTELKAEVLSSSCFIGDGKGGFTRRDLPAELQLAPVMAFTVLPGSNEDWIAGGNFFGTIPYEGRYDALLPSIFSIRHENVRHLLPDIDGEVRDMKWIKTVDGNQILAIARNNQDIVFLKPTSR